MRFSLFALLLYGVEGLPAEPSAMDLTDAAAAAVVPAAAGTIPVISAKTPDADTEAPAIRAHPFKPISSATTNGVLKRLSHPYNAHNHHLGDPLPPTVSYKDCLKNHAASLGRYAVDGCGEFMPSPSAVPSDPTSLKCAACGCHRNFHRRDPEDPPPSMTSPLQVLEFQPHHRHHPPPPARSPDSQSPPPISSSYYPSAPHMLLALSGGLGGHPENPNPVIHASPAAALHPNGRKRFRTKFTPGQKERMHHFAEKVGWKMQKKDEGLVAQFCSEVGVERHVLKVWMHNNKSNFGRKDFNPNGIEQSDGGDRHADAGVDDEDRRRSPHHSDPEHHHHLVSVGAGGTFGTNASSSSS